MIKMYTRFVSKKIKYQQHFLNLMNSDNRIF